MTEFARVRIPRDPDGLRSPDLLAPEFGFHLSAALASGYFSRLEARLSTLSTLGATFLSW
jgi:hypothetical protein